RVHLALLSFPTRRSSDLPRDGAGGVREQLRVVLDLAEVCRVVVGDTNLITTVGSIKVRVALRHICTENAHQRQQRLALQALLDRSEEHTSELQSRVELVC